MSVICVRMHYEFVLVVFVVETYVNFYTKAEESGREFRINSVVSEPPSAAWGDSTRLIQGNP